MSSYTTSTDTVKRSIEAYKRQSQRQLNHALKYVCAYLDGENDDGLEDAASCISFAAVSTIAILESSWRHFVHHHHELIQGSPSDSPDPNDQMKRFPKADSEAGLYADQLIEKISFVESISPVLPHLSSVQAYSIHQINLI